MKVDIPIPEPRVKTVNFDWVSEFKELDNSGWTVQGLFVEQNCARTYIEARQKVYPTNTYRIRYIGG
jgi:hypothetical protein